jgi:hypothetical protein
MADAPEIPEARDPFEKQVAVSIAGLAVCLAVVENKGDNAKTDAIIQTNEASNEWARYQSKSIKATLARTEMILLSNLQPAAGVKTAERVEWLKGEATRYESDEKEITDLARNAQTAAQVSSKVNDRCDEGALALQIAIVVASVAILSRWKLLWIVALVLGLLGAAIGVSAFLL